MKIKTIIFLFFGVYFNLIAQEAEKPDTNLLSIHSQTTVITQYKNGFNVKYSGANSLTDNKESATSITSTLFVGTQLWQNASIFINPELAGGSGISKSCGIADATNGESYRVGSPSPQVTFSRLFFRQLFPIGNEKDSIEDDFNQFGGEIPKEYFALTIGKISIGDYFDNNKFSHDPRTQFMSWGLMDNGAWDYPANTRGYTPSFVIEYVNPKHELRYAMSLVPKSANGSEMNWDIGKANSQSLEYAYHYSIKGQTGIIRLLGYFTVANMGSYHSAIAEAVGAPDITSTRKNGRTKYGFGINIEQNINEYSGCFFRTSWNDGKNETWAFTEIDHSASLGIVCKGDKWNRKNDEVGLAYVISGISKDHQDYLKAGGYGFIIGDGNLNYANEQLLESYYSMEFGKNIYLSGIYQFLLNPGYNKDRSGPVNIFSIRAHFKI